MCIIRGLSINFIQVIKINFIFDRDSSMKIINQCYIQQITNKNMKYSFGKQTLNKGLLTEKLLKKMQYNSHSHELPPISPQKRQKQLIMQIQSINCTLQHNLSHPSQYHYHQGFLFTVHNSNMLRDYNQRLVNALYECLKQNNTMIQSGFKILTTTDNPEKTSISRDYQSINQRMIKKCLQNVEDYQSQKKRLLRKPRDWIKYYQSSSKTNLLQSQNEILKKEKKDKNDRFKTQFSSGQITDKKKGIQRFQLYSAPKTNQTDNELSFTKPQIRSMINKMGQTIAIWVPPLTYPRFHGIFTYHLSKVKHITTHIYKQSILKHPKLAQVNYPIKCKILKYFFYRHSLSVRLFQAIIQCISQIEDKYVSFLELTIQKTTFHRLFEEYGWVLKCWDKDQVRIQYQRQQNLINKKCKTKL